MSRTQIDRLMEINRKLNTIRLASAAVLEGERRELFTALIEEVEAPVLEMIFEQKKAEQSSPLS